MNKLISIVVPVFNTEKYLPKCLDSIINQTYKNLEIICVNDGSTDTSLSVLEKYAQKDQRIKVISQDNSGLSAARNTGIKQSKGFFVTFIDSDDFVELNTYERCIEVFTKNNVDAVFFSANVICEDGYFKHPSDDDYYKVKNKGLTIVNPQCFLCENVSAWNKVYKLDVIIKNNLFFPHGLQFEDAEFYWKYVSVSKKIYFIEDKFYNYLRRRDSIMANTFIGSDRAIEHLKIMNNIILFWKKNNSFSFINEISNKLFAAYFWFSYRHSTKKIRKKVLHLAKKIILDASLKELFPLDPLIDDILNNHMYKYDDIDEHNFKQKIFSIKRINDYNKVVYLLGIRLDLKRKKYKKLIRNK